MGEDILCSVEGGSEARLPWSTAAGRLSSWSGRYDVAAARDDEAALLAIGREMFAWLDEAGWASGWADGAGDRSLEIVARRRDDKREIALLDAPWELLAREGGPLALDALQLFVVARRVGMPSAAWQPQHSDLQVMFMAAAPAGQVDLDYEREEASILEATRNDGRVHVVVEETGSLEFLGARLTSEEGPFEAVHLSCHGDIHPKLGPVLLLETAEGDEDYADAGRLMQSLGTPTAPLVVLSACRTAETGGAGAATSGIGRRDAGTGPGLAGVELAASFARQMVTQVANVVGWDGSVYDRDATEFAQTFYSALGRRSPVARAAAEARRALLKAHGETPQRGRHWHLARVYLGPQGGGPLCSAGKPGRKSRATVLEKAFLDKDRQRVPVASRAEFVGRRRSIQSALRALRKGAGVLVHGMGALGKSSLAARVASRMRHRPVLIFERYDALAVFDEVLEALEPAQRLMERPAWRDLVKADPACLAEALETWLSDALNAKPILLIVDDLERILETPRPDESGAAVAVTAEYRAPLGAILKAFSQAQTASRLLLTSRYDLVLPDGVGGDLAAPLFRLPLAPMPERERVKQLRAAERIANRESAASDPAMQALLDEALAAAAGNPGLQAILTRPILGGELTAAKEALARIVVYHATGAPPAEIQALIDAGTAKDSANALTVFFARLSFATYRDALTPDQGRQLAAATLFPEDVPIPRTALEAAGAALGVDDPATATTRLLALGLLDDWGMISNWASIGGSLHAAANPLARPLAPPLDPTDRPRLARAALPQLVAAWREPDEGFPTNVLGLAVAEIALEACADPDIVEAATFAAAAWLARARDDKRSALGLLERAMRAQAVDYAPGPDFLRLGIECADMLGADALMQRLLDAPIRSPLDGGSAATKDHAYLALRRAEQLARRGEVKTAEQMTRQAMAALQTAGDDRAVAIAAGQIADILQGRGETDEALRIRREEQLPVYDRLGDVRSRAVTMGKIADILQDRGETDEALRIRREEELPVYDRLGDVRSRANTMGKIADILQGRGETDEALRIRREEELPVYDRLGDVRSRAVALQKIASGLLKTGGLEQGRVQEISEALNEAFSIARRLQWPVGVGFFGAQLAQVMVFGELREEAMQVLDLAEEAFQKLGHAQGVAHVVQLRDSVRSQP